MFLKKLKGILFRNKIPVDIILPGVAQEFICQCKQQRCWIKTGAVTPPCPICGRIYKGVYSEKTLHIEAKEIKGKDEKSI